MADDEPEQLCKPVCRRGGSQAVRQGEARRFWRGQRFLGDSRRRDASVPFCACRFLSDFFSRAGYGAKDGTASFPDIEQFRYSRGD